MLWVVSFSQSHFHISHEWILTGKLASSSRIFLRTSPQFTWKTGLTRGGEGHGGKITKAQTLKGSERLKYTKARPSGPSIRVLHQVKMSLFVKGSRVGFINIGVTLCDYVKGTHCPGMYVCCSNTKTANYFGTSNVYTVSWQQYFIIAV